MREFTSAELDLFAKVFSDPKKRQRLIEELMAMGESELAELVAAFPGEEGGR